MPIDLIAGILNERFGMDFTPEQVQATGRTEDSQLFVASNDAGQAVEVELFDAAQPENQRRDIAGLNRALAASNHPGAFQPRSAGYTDDGHLYVLREAPTGASLARLIADKRADGGVFTPAEARELLIGVAEAIDDYDAQGLGAFVARSVDASRMLVQPAWSSVPVKLTLVGPTATAPEHAEEQHAANVASFIDLFNSMTGLDVDEDAANAATGCVGYLNAVAGEPLDEPEVSPVAPGATDGYRQPPQPYPYGPTGEYVRPEDEKKFKLWPWIAAIVALLLIAAGGIWYWMQHRGEEWVGVEAEIAETYPGIVSDKAGQKGWHGLICDSATPDEGQEGKIRCANETLGVSVAKYVSSDALERVLPDPKEAVVLGSGECLIYDYQLPDATPPAFVLTPRTEREYMVVINGDDAEAQRLDLPLCAPVADEE
ncbi:hypothetical protein [Corynebacterium sp. CCUG 51687]|uniref:hypothetical protein n=1 Tax=Corynebacterium sp. CCUG 51687 TaxID=2823897 RepID=UPI002109CEDB|nr:hypothetical protein [Corynebacterium sp. CCUG 51687]MCQ4612370.1 hypothetical protein [Corynebacterium sp. CCUG 51687]